MRESVRAACKRSRAVEEFLELHSALPTTTVQLLLQLSKIRPPCASAELAEAIYRLGGSSELQQRVPARPGRAPAPRIQPEFRPKLAFLQPPKTVV